MPNLYDQLCGEVIHPFVNTVIERVINTANDREFDHSNEISIESPDKLQAQIRTIFESCLIDFMAYDICCYDQRLTPGNITKEQVNEGRLKELKQKQGDFEKYVDDRTNTNSSGYKNYLSSTYPELMDKLNKICENLVISLTKVISHIAQDQEIICEAFISQAIPNDRITKIEITFSGKEFHRGQQQVLIVDIFTRYDKKGKFIYKPSSLVMDAVIVGDIVRLSQLRAKYPDRFQDAGVMDINTSIAQLINTTMQKDIPLPTYIVIPMRWENIVDSYGYIEFLEHDPTILSSITEKLKEDLFSAKIYSEIKRIKESFEESVTLEFKQVLKETYDSAAQGELSHSIISTDDNKINYAYLCGQWGAILRMFNVSDMHLDNIIIHDKKPFLIDLEFAMSAYVNSIMDTGLLQRNGGAFSPFSYTFIAWKFLCPHNEDHYINRYGKENRKTFHPGNNRLYMPSEKGLLPVVPDTEKFLQGFSETMMALKNTSATINEILMSNFIRSGFVRTAPFTTAASEEMIKEVCLLGNRETEKLLDEKRKENFDAWIRQCLKRTPKQDASSSDQEIFFLDLTRRPPKFLAYTPYAMLELRTGNVPCYYLSVTNNQLICGDGSIAATTQEEQQSFTESKIDPVYDYIRNNDYIPQPSPIQRVFNNFITLASEEGLRAFIADAEAASIDTNSPFKGGNIEEMVVELDQIVNRNAPR